MTLDGRNDPINTDLLNSNIFMDVSYDDTIVTLSIQHLHVIYSFTMYWQHKFLYPIYCCIYKKYVSLNCT